MLGIVGGDGCVNGAQIDRHGEGCGIVADAGSGCGDECGDHLITKAIICSDGIFAGTKQRCQIDTGHHAVTVAGDGYGPGVGTFTRSGERERLVRRRDSNRRAQGYARGGP